MDVRTIPARKSEMAFAVVAGKVSEVVPEVASGSTSRVDGPHWMTYMFGILTIGTLGMYV